MNHPEPDVLLRYADGEQVEPTTVEHLLSCRECGAALAELGSFEARVAAAAPIAPDGRRAMREVAERLLVRRPRAVVDRRRMAAIAVALAACVLAFFVLWRPDHQVCTVGVHRYEPADTLRGERTERFQIDVDTVAPRWLAMWRLDDKGPAQRLMPHPEPLLRYLGTEMPLPPGKHRVPATELLDFEFASDAAPTALLLVPSTAELQPAQLAAIEALLAMKPRDQLLAAIATLHGEAQLIAFPSR
ncbi:MAG: hypothetical protein ABIP94_23845 [Planctomycetota bacterium]